MPTRSRPSNLRALINCFATTGATRQDGVAILALTDVDDPKADQYESMLERLRVQQPQLGIYQLILPRWLPMVHKLDYVAQHLANDWYALGFMGDDHWPRTVGWHRQYLGVLNELGSGIVYGNDLLQGARLPTQWAMTGDLIQAWGRMVPAPVEHLYCDNAVLMAGRALGRIRYLPDAVIEHVHPAARKAPMDEQYARVNSTVQYQQDGERYHRWLKGGGPGRAAEQVHEYWRTQRVEVRDE